MATQTRDNVVGSSGPRESSEAKVRMEKVMAAPTGDNDAVSSEDAILFPMQSFLLQSRDLPSRRLVGKGLCGIVYETAWNEVKYARKDFVEVPKDIFLHEASGLLRLEEHKNIVKTYGYTVDNRSCSLVLEYMDDDLLSFLQTKRIESKRKLLGNPSGASRLIDHQEFMKESRKSSGVSNTSDPSTYLPPLELPEALDIMLQIATGMAYLHGKKIAHGDLKPRNILVSHSDEGEKSVKVADFGLIQSKSKSMFFVSRRARMFEMAQWKAPEYLEMCNLDKKSLESDSDEEDDMASDLGDNGELLLRADVYSFAVTSFQILTGEIPFPDRNWKELVKRKIRSKGLRPTSPAAFDPRLSDLLESCWGGSAQRPKFSAICNDLEGIMIKLANPAFSANVPEPYKFRAEEKPVIPVAPRKRIVPKPAIDMPQGKPSKVDVAATGSFAVPAYAVSTSPKRKKVSRAVKRFIVVSCRALKRPSPDFPFPPSPPPEPDLPPPGNPTSSIRRVPYDTHSGGHYFAKDHPVHHGEGSHFHDFEFDFAIPDAINTTSGKRWKKAFVRIPSKIQHWGVVSVQFCKPKSTEEEFIFPGDKENIFSHDYLPGSHDEISILPDENFQVWN